MVHFIAYTLRYSSTSRFTIQNENNHHFSFIVLVSLFAETRNDITLSGRTTSASNKTLLKQCDNASRATATIQTKPFGMRKVDEFVIPCRSISIPCCRPRLQQILSVLSVSISYTMKMREFQP